MRHFSSGLLILAVVMTTLPAHAGNRWNVTVAGGLMKFQGMLLAEACTVDIGDRLMRVSMGQIRSNQFRFTGQDINPVAFDIHLRDCTTNVSRRVGIAFQGVVDGKDPGVLSVGEGSGIATGVGVALFDEQDRLIPINTPPSYWTPLQNGPVTLHMVAKYRATGHDVTGGRADAQALFSLTYQ